MTKKTKKAEKRVYLDGFYQGGMNDVGEFVELTVEIQSGKVVSVGGDKMIEPIAIDEMLADLGFVDLRQPFDPDQKNPSEEPASSTEADSNPRKENQTTPSVAKKQNIRKPVVRTLRFDLSTDEIEAKCAGVSKKSRARAELEAEFARVRTDYKGRIEQMNNEIIADLRAVEDRAEHREVECDEVHDFEARMVCWDFEGVTYEQREMTPSERQMTFEEVL